MSTKPAARGAPRAHSDRVCVLFPGALGDFICCLPALQALAYKRAVDLYARREFAAIAPEGLTVYSLERPEIARLFTPEGATDAQVRKLFSAYAAVYSWMGSEHPEFAWRLRAAAGRSVRLFPFFSADPERHQAEYYFSCLHGGAERVPDPRILARGDKDAWLERFLGRRLLSGRPVMVIAPGSGAREKNWPADRFARVADWWRDRVGGAAVWLLGPVEEERGPLPSPPSADAVARGLDLAQSAHLMAAAHLYIGNDSGMTHLAAATGVRTVALFGPSSPRRWAPRGARVTLIAGSEPCAPCAAAEMKGCAHRRCLTEISADDVIAMLARLPEVSTLTR